MTDSSLFIFKLINEGLNYLHFLVVKLVMLSRLFFPWLGERRIAFEKRNETDPYAKSFATENFQADFTFEVSSQGEFQQILELIKQLLSQSKKVELIYASESLENDITKFKQEYSLDQLRCLRLPLIRRSFFKERQCLSKWITGKRFGFVRYDFYPHLLSVCFKQKLEMYLFWGSLKNKLNGGGSRWFWSHLAKCFKVIFAANQKNQKLFEQLNHSIKVYHSEMRTLSIESRLTNRVNSLQSKGLEKFNKYIDLDSRHKIIFGSAYLADLKIVLNQDFKQKLESKNDLIIIAPHTLSPENIQSFKIELEKSGLKYGILSIDRDIDFSEQWISLNVILLTAKGVLCELYSFCDTAYIGGGFEKSIHSVLEPFWGGCRVLCGPKTHRSTEFDFCHELNAENIRCFFKRNEIASYLASVDTYKNDFHNRESVFQKIIEQEQKNIGSLL